MSEKFFEADADLDRLAAEQVEFLRDWNKSRWRRVEQFFSTLEGPLKLLGWALLFLVLGPLAGYGGRLLLYVFEKFGLGGWAIPAVMTVFAIAAVIVFPILTSPFWQLYMRLPDDLKELLTHPHTELAAYQVALDEESVCFALNGHRVENVEWFEVDYRDSPIHPDWLRPNLCLSHHTTDLLQEFEKRLRRRSRHVGELELTGEMEFRRGDKTLIVTNGAGDELEIPDFFPLDEIEREIRARTSQD